MKVWFEGESAFTCSRATTGGRDATREEGRVGERGRGREGREKGFYVASPRVRRLSLFIGARGFVFEGVGVGGRYRRSAAAVSERVKGPLPRSM